MLINCNNAKDNAVIDPVPKSSELIQTAKESDTIRNYWEINTDTISDQQTLKTTEKNYYLKASTFSLNDSLIVRNLGSDNSRIYLDHSHTIVTDIFLMSDSNTDQKRIDRTDFKSILSPEFYLDCNLTSTKIDSISNSSVYLTSDLAIPDTSDQWRVWYLINITDNRLGAIEITKADYAGL